MVGAQRQLRLRALEILDLRAKQFRSFENVWPFRVPHEPLDLHEVIDAALGDPQAGLDVDALRSRSVLRMEWGTHAWELWVITLPSGIHLYCDSDGHETRILASVKRGNPAEADGFFLERLAQSRGHDFGIEMGGAPPDRVRASIGDRAFLIHVFVEMFEGSEAERALRDTSEAPAGKQDFRHDVEAWLDQVLTAPPPGRRQPRVREAEPG